MNRLQKHMLLSIAKQVNLFEILDTLQKVHPIISDASYFIELLLTSESTTQTYDPDTKSIIYTFKTGK